MVQVGQFIGPRRVAIFAKPPGDPTFVGRLVAFLLSGAVVSDPRSMSFDLSKERQHTRSYTWTRSPVEVSTTDNAIKNPDELVIRGTLGANPVGGLTGALGAFGSLIRRDRQAADTLRRIADEREPVAVVTPERPYGSMGIVAIGERHGDRNKIDVMLRLQTVSIVSPLLVSGVVDQDTLLAGILQQTMGGAQTPAPVPDPGGLG